RGRKRLDRCRRPTYTSPASVAKPSEFAQVCGHDRLRATPDQEEQCLAAPAARRMSGHIAGALGGSQRSLGRTQRQAVSPGAEGLQRADLLPGRQSQEVGPHLLLFGAKLLGGRLQIAAYLG